MEILQLKYFLESAKNESFTVTARKYMVPTTSVSASVKRLEKELGCELFDRDANRLHLNVKGKILMNALQRVFSELELAVEKLTACEDDTREIRLLVRSLRNDITEGIIAFRREHPHVSFRLEFELYPKRIEDYDIIIDEKSAGYAGFESFELYSNPLRLLVNADHPLCKRKLSLAELAEYPFISWGEGSNMHSILVESCRRAGFAPNVLVVANDMKCHERFIESGMGIGISRADSPMLRRGTIKALDMKDLERTYTVCCYYKKQSAYGNVKMFLGFLQGLKER